jgi:hypothetical protein
MDEPLERVTIEIDPEILYETIDGFGVNINSHGWLEHKLLPLVDLLVDDLGARLFRLDVAGKSNWVDPDGKLDKSILAHETYARVYTSPVFLDGWGMGRQLNTKGIDVYLTASGITPAWMCGPDGRTLADYDSFAELMASFAAWAVDKEKLVLRCFGPLNETDLGPPEGPLVAPSDFATVAEKVRDALDRRGLTGLKLALPEQAFLDARYVRELTRSAKLAGRIEAFCMHNYGTLDTSKVREIKQAVEGTAHAGTRLWFGEYGDMDQSGEGEWPVAWASTERLFDQLEAGFTGHMVWDAFDNYHDHDEHWTLYGLVRRGLRHFAPKKRYYAARQVYRFVLPGMRRAEVRSSAAGVRALAFVDGDRFTLVGMNRGCEGARLTVRLNGRPERSVIPVEQLVTDERSSSVRIESAAVETSLTPLAWTHLLVPPRCIFTVTNVQR